jgi:tetratricopeptide (TPR) repeat protein
VRDNLYATLLRRGRYEDALTLARTNLRVAAAQHTPPHPALTDAYQQVGHLLDNMGRSVEATPILRRTVQMRAAARGSTHVQTHSARVRYALCLVERGRLDLAARMLRDGEVAFRKTPPDSTTVDLARTRAILLVGKGRLHAERAHLDSARTFLRQGYRLRRRQAGLRAPLPQRALRALAEVAQRAGQPGRAATYRDSLLVR